MARKKETKEKKRKKNKDSSDPVGRFGNYTYRDLKKEAVLYGMPFPDVIEAGIGDLMSFISKSDNKPDKSLLTKYDLWMDEQLAMVNKPQVYTTLRLGYVNQQEDGAEKKPKKEKVKKKKRERDALGLFKGTKKSYTFELTHRGFTVERVTRRVLKKFPDASEKSISIWYNSAKRAMKKAKEKGK